MDGFDWVQAAIMVLLSAATVSFMWAYDDTNRKLKAERLENMALFELSNKREIVHRELVESLEERIRLGNKRAAHLENMVVILLEEVNERGGKSG